MAWGCVGTIDARRLRSASLPVGAGAAPPSDMKEKPPPPPSVGAGAAPASDINENPPAEEGSSSASLGGSPGEMKEKPPPPQLDSSGGGSAPPPIKLKPVGSAGTAASSAPMKLKELAGGGEGSRTTGGGVADFAGAAVVQVRHWDKDYLCSIFHVVRVTCGCSSEVRFSAHISRLSRRTMNHATDLPAGPS